MATMASPLQKSGYNRHWRWFANHLATVLAVLATILVIAPLVAIFIDLVYKGASSLNWNFFTRLPAPVGEPGGGMANAIVGSAVLAWPGEPDRDADWDCGGHIPVGIWARDEAVEHGAVYGGRTERRAVDRDGDCGVRADRGANEEVFGDCGRHGAGHHDDPDRGADAEEMLLMVPHSIREAALGLGVPNVAVGVVDYAEDGDAGSDYGMHVGICARRGGNGAAVVHGFGNDFWSTRLNQPIEALPLQIYVYALAPL